MHGARPVRLDTSDPAELKRFVKELSVAITKDMAEIRETELDCSGCYRKAFLTFKDHQLDSHADVFIDRLGRIVTPSGEPWTQLKRVQFDGELPRKVMKQETRYAGDEIVAIVSYIEHLETKKEDAHG